MSQELGWSRTLISGTVSAGAVTALALSPAIGWCIDRFGSRPVLVISMLVLGLAPDGDEAGPEETGLARGHEDRPATEESWTVGEALRTTAFWAVLLVGLAHFFVHTGVSVHIAAYLRDQGFSPANAAGAVSFSWVVSGVSAVIWGWALERVQPRLLYSIIMVCLAGTSLVLMFAPGALGAYSAALLIGVLSAGGLVAPTVVYGNFFGRAHLGAIRGIGETGVLIGQAAGPLFAGLMFDLRGSYVLVFAVYSVLAAFGMLLVLGARRPARRSPLVSVQG
jgi:MFS family permease